MAKFDAAAVARLERIYGAPEIAAQRQRARELIRARPGERGLENGCGPGFLACELAREVGPDGTIVAIDSSADMIAATQRRAHDQDLAGRIEAVTGDAKRLDFADGSFEFLVGVQVYLFVKEIEVALTEAARVLRPGGRLLIVDTDWDSCVWLTADRERNRRVLDARSREFAQPHLPPLLPGLLRRAGLQLSTVHAHPVLNLGYDPDSFSAGIIDAVAKSAINQGLNHAEAQAWAADLKGRTGEGEYFFSVNRYLFLARK